MLITIKDNQYQKLLTNKTHLINGIKTMQYAVVTASYSDMCLMDKKF